MNKVHILTVPIVEGMKIVEYKGLITARNVRAVNVVRDIFTSFRDFFGGRSGSYEDVMRDMEQEILNDIADKAQSMGANAVIGFSIDFDNVGAKNKSLLMAYGKGTAVVLGN